MLPHNTEHNTEHRNEIFSILYIQYVMHLENASKVLEFDFGKGRRNLVCTVYINM